ncbi:MAG TPA: TolC family protein, partial [Candidatus Saccharimonadales bacterium]|nr:TolC family protein [Candidatus Saccharimonadales bacterium]
GRTQEPPSSAEFRDTPPVLQLLTKQWSNFAAAAPVYTLEFLRSADRGSVKLSLKDAILVGLKNNPGIEVERLEPTRATEQTFGEESIFDPTVNFELGKNYSVDPFGLAASPFFQPVQTNQNRDFNVSLNKFFITGTQLELSFRNNYFVGSLPNQVLKPQYQPRLGFALTQPLLRGFGWGLTTIFVRISENREEVSLLGYRTKLAQLIQRITEAYWAVTYATENVRVQEKAIELADTLLRDAEAKVDAGLFAAIAITEARAERARREEQVIVAKSNLDIARADLRLTLNLNPNQTFLPRAVEPLDAPSVEPVVYDRQKSLEEAMTRRPEIQAAVLNVRNREFQLRYSENQLLPRLDLRAGAGLTGIAGDLKSGAVNPFPGSYGTSLERLGGGDYYNYSVGIVLQMPLGNGQAKSKFSQARIELDQERARQRDLARQITLEVERSVAEVESGFKRIQTTRQGRELAAENLRSQEKRFQVGLLTQKDVIDFQSKFIDAEGAELRAQTDYNNAIARLRFAEGTLLESYNVKVEGVKKEPDPWWAKF